LSCRVGATLAAGAFAIPIEPIPVIDVLNDIGVPALLIWYWFTFFSGREVYRWSCVISKPYGQKRSSMSVARRIGEPENSLWGLLRKTAQACSYRRIWKVDSDDVSDTGGGGDNGNNTFH
jgi:hypothetical protein